MEKLLNCSAIYKENRVQNQEYAQHASFSIFLEQIGKVKLEERSLLYAVYSSCLPAWRVVLQHGLL